MNRNNIWLSGLFLLAFAGFYVSPVMAAELTETPECPQDREKTPKAPDSFYEKTNPLEKTSKNIKKGKLLYMVKAKTLHCKHCHGIEGDGQGEMAADSFPNPRNFTCAETMSLIPDGQLFWAISHGVPHTSMPSYNNLKEKQVWQLILYIREFSKK